MGDMIILVVYLIGFFKNVQRFANYANLTSLVLTNIGVVLGMFKLKQIVNSETQDPSLGTYVHGSLFRRVADNGLVMGTYLFPFVIQQEFAFLYSMVGDDGISNYHYVLFFIIPLLLSLCTLISFTLFANLVQWKKHLFVYTLLLTACSYIIPNCVEKGSLALCLLTSSTNIGFSQVLARLCPRSFTFGELSVVSHGFSVVILYVFVLATSNWSEVYPKGIHRDVELDLVMILIISSILISFILSPVFYCLKYRCRTDGDVMVFSLCFYIGGILNIGCIFLPAVYATMSINPFLWVQRLILRSIAVQLFIGYCLCLVLFALLVVAWHTDYNVTRAYKDKSTTPTILVRKLFHFIAVGIFTPGFYYVPSFTRLACGVVFVIFVIFEYFRIFNIYPVGALVNNYLKTLRDERDEGIPILTHIYLLVGCCISLWMFPLLSFATKSTNVVAMYSGVISLGIGDSVASIVGKNFGKRTWPGKRKTFLGSFVSAICMFIFVIVLCTVYKISMSTEIIFKVVIVILITVIEEAFTNQIDNIVLPLLMYGCFVLFFN